MDMDKASREDTSFPTLPKWAPYHGSRPSSQNRKYILKLVLTTLLLGLLALLTFQAIRGASSPKVGDHSINWTRVHGNLELDLDDMVPPVAGDDAFDWVFNAYPKETCIGQAARESGKGIQVCEQISSNQSYQGVQATLLSEEYKICLYPDDKCSGNATAITTLTGCKPAANASYFMILFAPEAC